MRVAIVNDSKAAAEVLRRILLAESASFELIWTAYSGEEALVLCESAPPDVVLMDLIMPGIGGAETTRRMMQTCPCVILVVTATTVGNRNQVFEAMGFGALDAVNTPTLGFGGDMNGAQELLQKLRTVARLAQPSRTGTHFVMPAARAAAYRVPQGAGVPIVAIGASTGGPQALARVLSDLPSGFPAAVVIAQHVDKHFTPGLAAWLEQQCGHTVRIANAQEPLTAPGIWLAGSNDHLVVNDGDILGYTSHPRRTPYRPSVDALFNSLARPHKAKRIGVLLTGMGRDGAEGLLAMRNAGALTIAQDAATSVLYGMPKVAVELNAAMEVLPLAAIGPFIREAIIAAGKASPGIPFTASETRTYSKRTP